MTYLPTGYQQKKRHRKMNLVKVKGKEKKL